MTDVQRSEGSGKKQYNTPVLQVYGDLRILTQGFDVGKGGAEAANKHHFNSAP